MLNVKGVLDRYKVRTHVMNMGVQDIALIVRKSDEPILTAKKFVFDLFSMEIDITDEIYGGILCKHIVKSLIELNCIIRDDDEMLKVIDEAEQYTKQYCDNPNNSYLWSKDEPEPKKEKPEKPEKVMKEKEESNLSIATKIFEKYCSENDTVDRKDFHQLLLEGGIKPSTAQMYSYKIFNENGL